MFAGMKKAGNTESTGRVMIRNESRKYMQDSVRKKDGRQARNYRLLYLKGNTKGGEDGKIM